MIADVVPVTRIRRDVRWWTYQVPKGAHVGPGSLVSISLRGRRVPGVVWATQSSGTAPETLEVLTSYPLLLAPHRQTVELMAEYGLCSLPTALLAWMPPALKKLPTRSVRQDLIAAPQGTTKQHLVLMPGVRTEGIAALAAKGHLVADTFSARGLAAWKQWWAIRNGEVAVVAGRERAWFAPFVNLRHVHVVEPDDISYHLPQTPHLPLADLAPLLAKTWHAEVRFRSYLPGGAAAARWGTQSQGSTPNARVVWHTGSELPDELLAAARAGLPCRIIATHDVAAPDGEGRLRTLPGLESYARQVQQALGRLPRNVQIGTRSALTALPAKSTVWMPALRLIENASNPYDRLQGLADLGHVLERAEACIVPSGSGSLHNAMRAGALETLAREEVDLLAGQVLALSHPEPSAHHALKVPSAGWLLSHPRKVHIRGEETWLTTLSTGDGKQRIAGELRKALIALPAPWKVAWQAWYGR